MYLLHPGSLCAVSSLLHHMVLQVIPWLSGLKYEEKKKKVNEILSKLPGFTWFHIQIKARLSRKTISQPRFTQHWAPVYSKGLWALTTLLKNLGRVSSQYWNLQSGKLHMLLNFLENVYPALPQVFCGLLGFFFTLSKTMMELESSSNDY